MGGAGSDWMMVCECNRVWFVYEFSVGGSDGGGAGLNMLGLGGSKHVREVCAGLGIRVGE